MAAALIHDILDYCMNHKSPVYVCALEAEPVFDEISHGIMFFNDIDLVPEFCRRILVFWHNKLVVYIKWGESIILAVYVQSDLPGSC